MAVPGDLGELKNVRLNLAAAGTQIIELAATGKIVQVISFSFSADATTALPRFTGSSGTILAGPYCSAAGSSQVAAGSNREDPLFWTATGEGLSFITVGAGNVTGTLVYKVVSV